MTTQLHLSRWFAFVSAHALAGAVLAGSYTLDIAFAPRFEITGTVTSLAVQADNKVIVGGAFTTVNGVSRKAGICHALPSNGIYDRAFQRPFRECFEPKDWRSHCVCPAAYEERVVTLTF